MAPTLNVDAVDHALLESITPPPDVEATIARDLQLENQSRQTLLDSGCPPCYPPGLEFPLQNVPKEYQVVSYWHSLSGTGDAVLTAQLSDWEAFRKYQRKTRCYYLPRKTFCDFEEELRDRRQRHGLDADTSIRTDLEKQSQLQNWIEFQNYHLGLHELYERDLKKMMGELDAARENLETSRLKDLTVVRFLETEVENRRSKLAEHEKMLGWIEQCRKAMAPDQVISLEDSVVYHRQKKMPRSSLGPVRTAVCRKQLPQKSLRLRKRNLTATGSVAVGLDGSRSSLGLADAEDTFSRHDEDSTPHQRKNLHAQKARPSIMGDTNPSPQLRPNSPSKRRKASQYFALEGVTTRSGRVSRRPERLGFGLVR